MCRADFLLPQPALKQKLPYGKGIVNKTLCSGILLLGLLMAVPLTLRASQSYYPAKLDDPAAVYLTKDNFPVHADGLTDDSEAIQAAIDKVEDQHGEGILFVPERKYRITRTIYVWPSVRIIGYGATRPEFLLADNTPGYQQNIAYMFFFTGGRPGGRHWHARGPANAARPHVCPARYRPQIPSSMPTKAPSTPP